MTTIEPDEFPTPDDAEFFAEAPVATAVVLDPETIRVGLLLDENHLPETNGWMAVCRKCGMRTESPTGRHAPGLNQIAAAESWIDSEVLGSNIARLRSRQDT